MKTEQQIREVEDKLLNMVQYRWSSLTELQQSSLSSLVMMITWVLDEKPTPTIDRILSEPMIVPENN